MAARPRLEHVFAGCVLQCCGGTINALGGARLESGIIKRGCINNNKEPTNRWKMTPVVSYSEVSKQKHSYGNKSRLIQMRFEAW